MLAILDKAAALNLNAIILQVRPACDALYKSKIEPWSEFLTGEMGKAPDPRYDPLEFAVHQAHLRGIELHAWFNPYRAHHPSGKSPISGDHVSIKHPELVKSYGPFLWLDPGDKRVQDYSLRVILDVVKRYDIDGVHLDDYFYPYKEKDKQGRVIDFPDEPSWQKYLASGGKLYRDDWRRENVNTFIERLYRRVKLDKPWVKVGISPFGIWRPGYPKQIQGLDQYSQLYADAKRWLNEGWVDYWTPQLYWKIEPPAQSYPVLLQWWVEQNTKKRHMWPGNYTSRVGAGGGNSWQAEEIINQIAKTRDQPGAGGNVHFSVKTLLQDRGGLATKLRTGQYVQQALVPASPWLCGAGPGKPLVKARKQEQILKVSWSGVSNVDVWQWVVQTHRNGEWSTEILPGKEHSRELGVAVQIDTVAVSAVNRCGLLSSPVLWSAGNMHQSKPKS
jgi:uncharacterized lipoprotein YddW (UPF0748 family)